LFSDLADGSAGLEGFLGDSGGQVVAYLRGQGGAQGEGLFDHLFAALGTGLDTGDATFGEQAYAVGQKADRFEDVMGKQGHHDVEFEVTVAAGKAYGGVVAHDLGADLDEHFAHDGIDLAGHDAGAGLDGGDVDFAQTAARAGGEPADVVGDFVHGDGDGTEVTADFAEGVAGGLCFEMVAGFGEFDAGTTAEPTGDFAAEAGMSVQAGADGGSADGYFAEGLDAAGGACAAVAGLGGVTAELLAEADGGGVLEMGAADLDDGPELFGLAVEHGGQGVEGGDEVAVEGFGGGDVNGGGDDVVAGLAEVYVVVGVDGIAAADFTAGELDGPVGDDFVGVHVGGGTRAGLEDVHDEVLIELAVDDFLCGGGDEFGTVLVESAEGVVDFGGGLFDQAYGPDEPARKAVTADGEVFHSPLGLGAPQGPFGDFDLA